MIQDTTHGTRWNVSRMAVITAIVLPSLLRNKKSSSSVYQARVPSKNRGNRFEEKKLVRIFPQVNRAKFPFPSLHNDHKITTLRIVHRPQFTYIRWEYGYRLLNPPRILTTTRNFAARFFSRIDRRFLSSHQDSSIRHHIPLRILQTTFLRFADYFHNWTKTWTKDACL